MTNLNCHRICETRHALVKKLNKSIKIHLDSLDLRKKCL